MKHTGLLLLLWCVSLVGQAQSASSVGMLPQADSISVRPLKLLSYNIHMLPPLIKFTGKQRRARRIAELLKASDLDIVVFQEAFHGGARRRIARRMRGSHPYMLGPANRRWGSFRTNSGIWILSRIPLKQVAELDFDYCEGIDCWSRKGALVAEGEYRGTRFQLLGTHLEAGGPKEARVGQYRQLDSVLAAVRKPNVPQIVAGDFNTDKLSDTTWYGKLVRILGVEDGPLLSQQQYTSDSYTNDIKIQRGDGKKQKVIDFVFYRNNGLPAKVNRFVRMPRSRWSKHRQDLSDHYAVEAHIFFEP